MPFIFELFTRVSGSPLVLCVLFLSLSLSLPHRICTRVHFSEHYYNTTGAEHSYTNPYTMSRLLTYSFMLVVIFSLALTTPANGTIIIKAGLRLSQSLNNVALGCEDTMNMNTQLPSAVFQRAIGLNNQFMDFNYTVTNNLAEFIITPQTEGRYRCQSTWRHDQ